MWHATAYVKTLFANALVSECSPPTPPWNLVVQVGLEGARSFYDVKKSIGFIVFVYNNLNAAAENHRHFL